MPPYHPGPLLLPPSLPQPQGANDYEFHSTSQLVRIDGALREVYPSQAVKGRVVDYPYRLHLKLLSVCLSPDYQPDAFEYQKTHVNGKCTCMYVISTLEKLIGETQTLQCMDLKHFGSENLHDA